MAPSSPSSNGGLVLTPIPNYPHAGTRPKVRQQPDSSLAAGANHGSIPWQPSAPTSHTKTRKAVSLPATLGKGRSPTDGASHRSPLRVDLGSHKKSKHRGGQSNPKRSVSVSTGFYHRHQSYTNDSVSRNVS